MPKLSSLGGGGGVVFFLPIIIPPPTKVGFSCFGLLVVGGVVEIIFVSD
jgi:hypothetical protein